MTSSAASSDQTASRPAGSGWTPADLPDLGGLRAVVTGANSGLGYYTALELARHGAHVVLACRDVGRAGAAADRLCTEVPDAEVETTALDLADLTSVRAFAALALRGPAPRLDLLVNNAGVMAVPRGVTADGFERQVGTNHLGHFALTGLLLPALLRGSVLGGPARVVTVSSALHRSGRLDRDDLLSERAYGRWAAYGRSKLANLLFTYELQRRAERAGWPLAALAAHPGYAATNLQSVAPGQFGGLRGRLEGLAMGLGNRVVAQPAAHGAWPSLRAAADPAARGGEFYGPGGWFEQRGHPVVVASSAASHDEDDACWLWERSVALTGVGFSDPSEGAVGAGGPAEIR